ncbi:hypothetical protein SANTM175S_06557 [Streptomyces antimycoticus]
MEAITILALLFVAIMRGRLCDRARCQRGQARHRPHAHQARRTVEDTTLRARPRARPAPPASSPSSGSPCAPRCAPPDAQPAAPEDPSLGVVRLFRRLSAHGQELEAELKRLECVEILRRSPACCRS